MNTFIKMLKSSKQVYCECPNCKISFSLYGAKLFSGKSPPKYALTHTIGKLQGTIDKLSKKCTTLEADNTQTIANCDALINDLKHYNRNIKAKLKSVMANEYLRHKLVIDEKMKAAVAGSKSNLKGRIAEMYPDFPRHGINPLDVCVTTPKPIDFIVFNGYDNHYVTDIIFCDAKANTHRVTPRQRSIKNTIENGQVSFKLLTTNVTL